jgi:hypothetical protein
MLIPINFNEFEEKIIESLKDSNLIDKFSKNEFKTLPSIDIITEAFEKAHLIK